MRTKRNTAIIMIITMIITMIIIIMSTMKNTMSTAITITPGWRRSGRLSEDLPFRRR